MNKNIIEILQESIDSIYDEFDNIIEYSKLELILKKNEDKIHSLSESIEVYLDGKKITTRNKKVLYKCSCGAENKIFLKKFLDKDRLRCNKCREDFEKRMYHSLFFTDGIVRGRKTKTNTYVFDNETDCFKQNYFARHLYANEFFEKMLPNIISINGIEICDKSDIQYLEHERVKNQYKYFPHVIINNKKTPFINVVVKCPKCGREYKISDRRSKREKIKTNFLCKDCSFANKNFPIKTYVTKFNDIITYQSKLELKFIQQCEQYDIRILNGQQLPYVWMNGNRVYHVDFYLPSLSKMIEIKGNHIWHRKQIENGKWGAKEKVALDYALKNNLFFEVLFEKDFYNFFKTVNEIV